MIQSIGRCTANARRPTVENSVKQISMNLNTRQCTVMRRKKRPTVFVHKFNKSRYVFVLVGTDHFGCDYTLVTEKIAKYTTTTRPSTSLTSVDVFLSPFKMPLSEGFAGRETLQ